MLKPKLIIIFLIVGVAIGAFIQLRKPVHESPIGSPVSSPSDDLAGSTQQDAFERVSQVAEESTAPSNLAVQPSATVAQGIRPPLQKHPPEHMVLTGSLGPVMTYREVRTDKGLVGIQILPAGEAGALRPTGFFPGDLIVAVNGIAIEGSADSDPVIRSLRDTGNTTATVVRNGRKLDIVLPSIP